MKSRFFTLSLLAAALLLPNFVVSCASSDPGNYKLKRRLDEKNARHADSIERRSLRRQARDDRYNAWFDMIMQ